MLYLATLRAGYVYLPLNTRLPGRRDRLLHRRRRAGGGGLRAAKFRLGQQARLPVPARAMSSRSTTTARGSLLERAARAARRARDRAARGRTTSRRSSTPRGTTGRSKGAMLTHGNLRRNAQVLQRLLGLARGRRADPCAADLPRARPVRRHPWRAAQRQQDALAGRSSTRSRCSRSCRDATVFMGVPTLLHAAAGRARPRRARPARNMRLFISRLGAAADGDLRRLSRAHRPHHPRALRHERDHRCSPPTRTTARRARAAARSACRCRASAVRVATTTAAPLRGRRDRRHRRCTGPNVFAGYWRMPEKTRGGIHRTTAGSRPATSAASTRDGYLTIVGRSKDLDHHRRLQRLPERDRGLINEMPGVAESRGDRRAAPRLRRGGGGGRRRRSPARRSTARR